MSSTNVKISVRGKYNGHSIKPNGVVQLVFKVDFDELLNYYPLLPALRSVDTTIKAKVKGKALPLGVYMLNKYVFDHDGEGTITFNSQSDYIEANNLNELIPAREDRDTPIQLLFTAQVESENDEGEDE